MLIFLNILHSDKNFVGGSLNIYLVGPTYLQTLPTISQLQTFKSPPSCGLSVYPVLHVST